jgi:hypothetical protein
MPKSRKGKGCAEPPHHHAILNESDSLFLVDIKDSKTVGHLKKTIMKEKPVTFANVDADQLKLWKVSGFSPLTELCLQESQLSCKASIAIDRDLKSKVTKLCAPPF